MQTYSGHSSIKDAMAAVQEATCNWPKDWKPDMIFAFHSTDQDAEMVALCLEQRFPSAKVAGCTTAGEHLNGRHYNGTLVLTAIESPGIKWHVEIIENLKEFKEGVAQAASEHILAGLGIEREQLDPSRHFALCLIDGLSMKEETVASLMAEALEGIPFLGGSAGDDLKFQQTYVMAQGRSYQGAAVIICGESETAFAVIKHQHFLKTPKQLVITRCDVASRRVYEIDGRPAAEAYAEAVGVERSNLTAEVCFANPVVFRVNNEIYVRSVQRIEEDQSLVFYCAVEEGMVVEIGGHEDMEGALARDSSEFSALHGTAELFIAWNCILRSLESTSVKNHEVLGRLMRGISPSIIGFDTYGEQLNGLHINQTLVGIAFGRIAA